MNYRALVALSGLLCGITQRTSAQEGGVATNFDFVPGERVLFAEDFAKDKVGNFPKRLRLVVGNMEIIETGGKRFLRSTSTPRPCGSCSLKRSPGDSPSSSTLTPHISA